MRALPAFWLPCLSLALLLSACGANKDEKPGGVTQDEARALDAAAEMLDKRQLPPLPEASLVPQVPTPAPR